jgi:hypothetical protein
MHPAHFGPIDHLPAWEEIPEDFRYNGGVGRGDARSWCELAERWLFEGLSGVRPIPKPGVDPQAALRAVRAILCSFAPKHEHKIAGCAFLLSEWFERFDPASPAKETA